jgi:hypothetical protein
MAVGFSGEPGIIAGGRNFRGRSYRTTENRAIEIRVSLVRTPEIRVVSRSLTANLLIPKIEDREQGPVISSFQLYCLATSVL